MTLAGREAGRRDPRPAGGVLGAAFSISQQLAVTT
jgi:hypothetical protein